MAYQNRQPAKVFPTPVGMNRRASKDEIPLVLVFPTPVGVNPGANFFVTFSPRIPHTRGGEPLTGKHSGTRKKYSPHPWG